MKSKKQYLLFDGRYRTDEDRAICYAVYDTEKEAKKECKEFGDDTVIVEFDLKDKILTKCKIIN